MLKNWQTSLAGVGLILTGAGMGLTALSGGEGDLKVAFATVLAGVGLLRASDAS